MKMNTSAGATPAPSCRLRAMAAYKAFFIASLRPRRMVISTTTTASERATPLKLRLNANCPGAYGCTMLNSSSRSEEHTSELQSQSNLVCRLLLEKKKKKKKLEVKNRRYD